MYLYNPILLKKNVTTQQVDLFLTHCITTFCHIFLFAKKTKNPPKRPFTSYSYPELKHGANDFQPLTLTES